jgi:monomeric isocitrate dehydrogenase
MTNTQRNIEPYRTTDALRDYLTDALEALDGEQRHMAYAHLVGGLIYHVAAGTATPQKFRQCVDAATRDAR